MYSIDYLKQLSNSTVKLWIHKHMVDTDGVIGEYAAHHEMINGKLTFRMITFDEFFQHVESDINSQDITFDFVGCGIKGPLNLYLAIKKELNVEYLNYFPVELKQQIIQYVSHHEYLKKLCDSYDGELPDTKTLLGMYYLAYTLDNKNEIYDILLDYKMRVVQYNLEI
jgi:hypothetical protein